MEELQTARAALIEATWNVLERTGFEGFKVSSVTRATGVSMRTFYRCFPSKDDLFIELMFDETRRGAARIERLVAHRTEPAEQVMAWVAAMMSATTLPELTSRTRLFVRLGEQIEGRSEALAATREMLLPSLIAPIEAGCRAGTLHSASPRSDAILINALCRAATSDIVHCRTDYTPAEVVTQVQSMVRRALRPE